MCPHYVSVGDIVIVLHGVRVAYLFRQKVPEEASGRHVVYQFVGDYYMHGYMGDQVLWEKG